MNEQLSLLSVPDCGPQLSETVKRGGARRMAASAGATFYDGDTYRVCEVRACVVREDSASEEARVLNAPDKCARFWSEVVAVAPWFDPEKECVALVILDRKNRVRAWNVVSQGTATASLLHPREVLRAVIVAGGTAFVVMHNHPSGDPAPSSGDVQVTRAIREAARVLDTEFLDHVVIGRKGADTLGRGWYSFREAGLL
jgi:DNA repair protein RadC